MLKRMTTACATVLAGLFGAAGSAAADQTHFTLSLAPGAMSAPITIPISDSPVIASCTQISVGNVGTGQATLVRSTADGYVIWEGYDITGSVTNGQSTLASHVVYCDFSKTVDIEAPNATQIQIVNKFSVPQTVVLMLTF